MGLVRFPEGREAGDRWFTEDFMSGLARVEGVQRIRCKRSLLDDFRKKFPQYNDGAFRLPR